jgi:hypothetical protein
MNRVWHDAHPMPKNANLQQRIEWHIAHAEACGCRDMPESVKRALADNQQADTTKKPGSD